MTFDIDRATIRTATRTATSFARFSFYAAGIFGFVSLGLLASWIWTRLPGYVPGVKSEPVFQVRASVLAHRPQTLKAETNAYGWMQSLQYGQLYDRDVDLTMVMIVPHERYQTLTRDYAAEIAGLRPLYRKRYLISSNNFYDLETRFGAVRASEFSINADGRAKLCISYLSRFQSDAFYLKGWYCEANGARPSFSALACIIDQLALGKPLKSKEATAFITERMKRPPRCYADPVSQTTDTGSRRPLKRLIR